LKILLTVDPFLPVPPKLYGGIERIVASLIDKLRSCGHTVGLVALAGSSAPVDFFVPWPEAYPTLPLAHLRNAILLRRACNEFAPTLIHSFSRLLYLGPLLRQKIPKVMSYQRSAGGRQTQIAARLGGASLAFTGCSEFIASMGRQYGGRWYAIPNFVDTEFYRFSPTVASDAPLVFLSRIEPIKGAHIAIKVAKRTARRLIVAGNHAESGAEGDYWEARIKPELGKNGIEYVGPVDDQAKIELLGSAAALIVPVQWDEPFGIVFAEALACGTPVISCPRGALPEIVGDGTHGFLVKGTEEASLAVANISKIDRHECRLRAVKSFSAATVVPRYEALYRALTEDEPVPQTV
jgi:glycosyltransferase involved in cell wall biosynthesis